MAAMAPFEFMYRHDCHTLSPDHELVKGLSEACSKTGIQPEISAMAASCDSWFYNNQLKHASEDQVIEKEGYSYWLGFRPAPESIKKHE